MTTRKSPRVRCAGECGNLYPRGEMVRIGAEWYCPDDWAAKAKAEAPPPEDETAKSARLAEARRRAGTTGVPVASGSAAPAAEPVGIEAAGQDGSPDPPFLAAPSVTPSFTLDLGDPEEVLAHRKDLPDEAVDDWPLRRGRLSASALGCFLLCPEQFRRRYVAGEYQPSGGNAAIGNAAHTALTAIMQARILGGDLPRSQWQEWLDAKLDHDEERGVEWGESNKAHGRFIAGRIVDTYLEHVAPSVRPVAVDEVFTTRVAGVPVPVVGFLDLRTERKLVDWKFGAKVSNEISPEWRVQGLTYLLSGHRLPVAFESVGHPKKDETCSVSAGGDRMMLDYDAANTLIARTMIRSVVTSIRAYATAHGVDGPWTGNVTHTWACKACSFREEGCVWWPQAKSVLPIRDPFAVI